jgi:hypothetical protein
MEGMVMAAMNEAVDWAGGLDELVEQIATLLHGSAGWRRELGGVGRRSLS